MRPWTKILNFIISPKSCLCRRMKPVYMMQLNKKLLPPWFLSVRFSGNKPKKGKKYSETLNLPKTDFHISMKNVAERELSVQKVGVQKCS